MRFRFGNDPDTVRSGHARLTLWRLALLLTLTVSLTACESVSYYSQAVAGQLSILSGRQDIEDVIEAEATAPALRGKLETVLEIRDFAGRRLHLPLDRNYSTYVDTGRRYAVWNVFATPEFSMQPLSWCYPVAGCVSYRGYFSEQDARNFAAKLEREGHDVYVGGVSAYSTLGWFSDPVLNTIIERDDHELARLLFHELAHQVVYVSGDTAFNESFATAVEQAGLQRWLESTRDRQRARTIVADAQRDMQQGREFVALVAATVEELESLYAKDLGEAAMRREKQAVFAAMRAGYRKLRASWGGDSRYDGWFNQPLNNAQLNTVATYNNWVPAFNAMLREAGGDLQRFYDAVRELAELDRQQREAFLRDRMS